MFRKNRSTMWPSLAAGAVIAVILAACSGPGAGPATDPFAELPTPATGVAAQGVFTSSAKPRIEVNGIPLGTDTVMASANLTESADGVITGHVAFTGLDGNEYPVLISGENDNGKITIPLNLFLCNREVEVTLYGTIAENGAITVAGDSDDLTCYGQNVSVDVPQFTVAKGEAE